MMREELGNGKPLVALSKMAMYAKQSVGVFHGRLSHQSPEI